MAIINTITSLPLSPALLLPLFLCVYFVSRSIYRIYLHPLSHIPGPLLARITSLYLYTLSFRGIECHVLSDLHKQYSASVVRVGPNAVSVSDGAALHQIYVANGGFPKDERYSNFDIDGHPTIFSSRDPAYRDARAKAVLPLFAMGKVRAAGEAGGVMQTAVDKFVGLFQREKHSCMSQAPDSKIGKLELMDLCMKLTADVTTGYLFDMVYGDLDAELDHAKEKVPIAPSIHKLIGIGGISLLPNWLFSSITAVFVTLGRLFPDQEFDKSLGGIDAFKRRVVESATTHKDDNFQSRLLAAGIPRDEAEAQCKAVTFAGTDSTAVKLVTLIFHLVQNPQVRKRLMEECQEPGNHAASTDPQKLPYLRAVVREGLRLGMANPARLTRIVPPGGIEIGGVFIPPRTNIGASAWTLHHNPSLFPDPFVFRPERWLDDGGADEKSRKREMDRDVFPFGLGTRTCLARNLATHELFVATRAVVESGVLEGARTCDERIELEEYFNAGVKNHKVEIEWT